MKLPSHLGWIADAEGREAKRYARTAIRRWVAAAAVVVVVTTLQIVTARPAAALPALELVIAGYASGLNQDNPKWVEANCPPGKVVVGGGGEIIGNEMRTFMLTGLEPRGAEGPKPPRFVAYGVSRVAGETWTIRAYALCVDAAAMQPYRINHARTATSDGVFKSAAARCPAGTVAYSAGGMAPNPWGGFGLQMVRTSGALDIGRATVRATSDNVTEPWSMTASVVCGPRKDGIAAHDNIVDGSFAGLQCPPGQQIHGAGGGLGLSDGGGNWLRTLHPIQQDPRAMRVRMTLLNPGYQTLAHATCASRTS